MPRTTHTVASRRRKKKILKRAKGFVGGRRSLFRTAKETVDRAMAFATRDRKQRKRQFRGLWNARINAACRANGTTYSRLIAALKKANITLNRKSLAEIAARDEKAFLEILKAAQKS
ncbi:MAG: 50S ribosomal protein L20 [Candidatus Omnitrophica bacterium ADurb.Bin292]|jgi:large subunit ribosomal protein L20|nr:MAG: 50S ribosomal protein L20 [Candidatus Omnitrophica bacterium ADurb.Bin292]HOG23153.1 50S ribosomal protein L20 [Candidatus Omnitrophota bacterium]HPW76794.1 50S ribosomal protein L20 [Candidatus Omnitrophota bacterium]HQB11629.1 50S ribosomal protein L20 [Candidatus Omnitrophota bacterium]